MLNSLKRKHLQQVNGARKRVFIPCFKKPQETIKTTSFHNSLQDTNILNERRFHIQPCADLLTTSCFTTPEEHGLALKPVALIPERYRSVFNTFPYFNVIQSEVFDDTLWPLKLHEKILYTDHSAVISAPTGSGKTVVFELAIVRLMIQNPECEFKIVYMAPIKALCAERFNEWNKRFGSYGVKCVEITGDTNWDDYSYLHQSNIILTTPEKWDSITRQWRCNSLVRCVRLFLIDEVHILNDESRGATLEAVISRMKTTKLGECQQENQIRFIAISATVANADDIASWFETGSKPALNFKFGDEVRPVKLKKIVFGYQCNDNTSDYMFDFGLNYKLSTIIGLHSDGKPTLVFCSTRKGVVQAANIVAKEMKQQLTNEQANCLRSIAGGIKDGKLKEFVASGVGFHHAGLETNDRRTIEEHFSNGRIPVLMATATLAMGVNLPAHLVIIKSTMHYVSGNYIEYSKGQILQMIGRGGRPQFDESATAVIMTKAFLKQKYENLVGGEEVIESCLHNHLVEHLNAEIVRQTITNLSIAMDWLRSTFLYIRCLKNPKHYGIPEGLTTEEIEKKLFAMCIADINDLAKNKLLTMCEDGFMLTSTDDGKLMARYCMAFETMQMFAEINGTKTLSDLLMVISSCKEFYDVQLRVNEKRTLNTLNKNKNSPTIRFPMTGKIKTREMKIDCLVQAILGCLQIPDSTLNQEALRVFRIGQRITKCLSEYMFKDTCYETSLNVLYLSRCFVAKLWEDSKHVARQLDKIGLVFANALVNNGLQSFKAIEETNPRQLELLTNRNPPFGNMILSQVTNLPKLSVYIEQKQPYKTDCASILTTVVLHNWEELKSRNQLKFSCVFLVGDSGNRVLMKKRLTKASFMESGNILAPIEILKQANEKPVKKVTAHVVVEQFVGLDACQSFSLNYERKRPSSQKNVAKRQGIAKQRTTLEPDFVQESFSSIPDQSSEQENCTKENYFPDSCTTDAAVEKKMLCSTQPALKRFFGTLKEKLNSMSSPASYNSTLVRKEQIDIHDQEYWFPDSQDEQLMIAADQQIIDSMTNESLPVSCEKKTEYYYDLTLDDDENCNVMISGSDIPNFNVSVELLEDAPVAHDEGAEHERSPEDFSSFELIDDYMFMEFDENMGIQPSVKDRNNSSTVLEGILQKETTDYDMEQETKAAMEMFHTVNDIITDMLGNSTV